MLLLQLKVVSVEADLEKNNHKEMKSIINWLAGLLKDEKGTPSSKRFIGILAGISLCITLFANQFTEEHIAPSPVLINAVAALAFGALGLASVDKIWGNKDKNQEE
jgi:xanthine/uracil permease